MVVMGNRAFHGGKGDLQARKKQDRQRRIGPTGRDSRFLRCAHASVCASLRVSVSV